MKTNSKLLNALIILVMASLFITKNMDTPEQHQAKIDNNEQKQEQLTKQIRKEKEQLELRIRNNDTVDRTASLSKEFMLSDNIYVVDDADILSDNQKIDLYKLNKDVFESFNGKPQIAFVTLPHLPSNTDMATYRHQKFQELGIGQKNENNGLLFVLAIADNPDGTAKKRYGFEVGYGLEDTFPDSIKRKLITDEVIKKLQENHFDEALMLVATNIQTHAQTVLSPMAPSNQTITTLEKNLQKANTEEYNIAMIRSLEVVSSRFVYVLTTLAMIGYAAYTFRSKKQRKQIHAILQDNHYIDPDVTEYVISQTVSPLKSKNDITQQAIIRYELQFKQICKQQLQIIGLHKNNETPNLIINHLIEKIDMVDKTTSENTITSQKILKNITHTINLAINHTTNKQEPINHAIRTFTKEGFDQYLYQTYQQIAEKEFVNNKIVDLDTLLNQFQDKTLTQWLNQCVHESIKNHTSVNHFADDLYIKHLDTVITHEDLNHACKKYLAENQHKYVEYEEQLEKQTKQLVASVHNEHFSAIPTSHLTIDYKDLIKIETKYPKTISDEWILEQIYDVMEKQANQYLNQQIKTHILHAGHRNYRPYRAKSYEAYVREAIVYSHYYHNVGLLNVLHETHERYNAVIKTDQEAHIKYLDAEISRTTSIDSSSFGGGSSGGGGFSGDW